MQVLLELRRRPRMEQLRVGLWMVTTLLICLMVPTLVGANIAVPVEQCDATGCTINNAYATWPDRISCKAALVVYPTTELDIVNAVATAVKYNQTIKVGTKYGHSFPKLTCPGSGSGSGLIISTKNYTSILSIDTSAMTVTAQSGIQLRDLLDAIANQSLALPVSPYWDALTLGGLLATGSHGSSHFGLGGAVHEYVIGMSMVLPATAAEGYAKVITLNQTDPDLNATKVSLGVLGVVSTVTLQLEPTFKRNVTLQVVNTEVGMEDRILEIAKTSEFGDVTWFPSTHQVIYRIDQRVPANATGNGVSRFYGFQARAATEIEFARSLEDLAESTRDQRTRCQVANLSTGAQLGVGFGFGQFFPVIGQQHLIQSGSGCQKNSTSGYYCPWDRRIKGLLFFEASAAIPILSLKDFITDVKALREMNLLSFCGLDVYIGFFIRFVKASSGAYLGAQEDVAMVDFTYYRANNSMTPRLDEDIFEEIEQIAFYKYGAKPHWAKNRNYAFEGIAQNFTGAPQFRAVKAKFDPQGLFSSSWSDTIFGDVTAKSHDVSTLQPSCALEGLCVCKEDIHCAPDQKYFCRPGRVYSAANVCRFEDQAASPAPSPSPSSLAGGPYTSGAVGLQKTSASLMQTFSSLLAAFVIARLM